MNQSYLRGIYLRLAGAVTLVVMLALAANALLSHRIFEKALAPQMAAKVTSAGSSIRALVLRAVDNGIPFEGLYGVTDRFAELKDEVPDWEPWVGFFLRCLKKQKDGLALRLDRSSTTRRHWSATGGRVRSSSTSVAR